MFLELNGYLDCNENVLLMGRRNPFENNMGNVLELTL